VESGINLIDTAPVYGFGHSEEVVGKALQGLRDKAVIATKAALEWSDAGIHRNASAARIRREVEDSLRRLKTDRIDLYQIHWPFPPVPIETWMAALADAVEAGLTRYVGVSNYNVEQTRRAHAALAKRGIALASNQVDYSLLNRKAEFSGLLETCKELGITLIAYSPLAQGLLTGKYTSDNPPPGIRGRRASAERMAQVDKLLSLLRRIGQNHGGKTPAQVALNWVICKGAIPIPGVKNARQAQDNTGALGCRLSDEDVASLDKASRQRS